MDDLLVDARSGVLTSLEPHIRSDMPTGLVGWAARVADTRNFGGSGSLFRADPYGFGASIRNDAAARGAATGEAVERYCGNVVPEDLVRSSASALELAGSRVVDPAKFALYSEDQYRLPGFPFVPFTSDLNIRWALGHTMDEKVPTYVPAALTYLGYYTGTRRCEPPIASLQYAGIAAGRSRDEAEMSALLELLERDATALWWCGDRSQPAIELSDWERLPAHRQLGDLESQTRSVRVLLLPSPFGIPVATAWIRDDRRGLVALGTACRPTVEAAVSKALVEAYAVLAITIDLADPDGPTWRSVADGTLPAHLYKPFRADRRYRDEFDPQWKDVVDLPTVAQLYLDPTMALAAEEQLFDYTETLSVSEIPDEAPLDLASLVALLTSRGHQPISVDLTTGDISIAGLHVVRVLTPGLYNNAPAAFPLLGGSRLTSASTTHLHLPVPLA